MSNGPLTWRRRMRERDPGEEHRASTPLELLFDLCFVVAVAQAAAELHHALAENHLGAGLAGYVAVFFAIWWAWMNFTWFASAYDTDDAPYRVLTLVQMAGVLVLAAGVPRAFEHYDFSIVVVGYVLMRIGLVAQWLRAAAAHPEGRPATLRYAVGILIVQAGWIARLWAPGVWGWITFVVLAIAEMAVPAWAEFRGRATMWHPGHIAERYGLFTIIVLGEVILATLTAVQSAFTEHGVSAPLIVVAVAALILVFAVWWIYFTGAQAHLRTLRIALTWGYGHFLVFGSIAALGAGLEVAVDALEHKAHVSEQAAALAVAVPVVVVLLVLAALHRISGTGAVARTAIVLAGAVLALLLAFSPPLFGLPVAIAGIAVVVAATLAANLTVLSSSDRP